MVHVTSIGSFAKMNKFLEAMKSERIFNVMDSYGRRGVDLLSSATPIDTGDTAASWEYEVKHQNGRHTLAFYNTNVEGGVNVAIILQYGHGTGTGGYVEGIDYINPTLRPLFDKLADDLWREVTNA